MLSKIGDHGKSFREKFIDGEQVDASAIQSEVLASWQRCKGVVNPKRGLNTEIWPDKEFERIKLNYRELIEIAVPVMENLYNFIRGSGFSITLEAIEDGKHIMLEHIGDPEAIAMHRSSNAIPGSNWSETVMGTSASTIAVFHDRPFQVRPEEHWCACLKYCTTSAAPVHDPETRQIIGVVTIAASYLEVQSHTLGMVVAAVDSIEKQMAVRRLARKSEIANHFKTVIMECFSDGLVAIDQLGTVMHVNQNALGILGFEQEPVGQNIFYVLNRTFKMLKGYRELLEIIDSETNVMDQFVSLHKPGEIIRCVVSTRFMECNGEILGKILIIQQMSRAAKLVSSALGNYARFTFFEIIGQEPRFLECIKIGIKVAKTSSNVLLLGESGTGKDLFAQAIHNASSRKDQPFIAINCAAIPRDLLGSELFGYVEGAFTGAKKGGSPGKFELADGGTIFLDEIGEMPIDMQTSLLRVLEEKAVTRIGDKTAIAVDVRVIAATNKDLGQEVEKGNFRADLYYRINVVNIEIPPLRERTDDIPLLIYHFVDVLSKRMEKKIDLISPELIQICSEHQWPGNIRQLQNVIDRAVNLAEGNILTPDLLPEVLVPSVNKRQNIHLGQRLINVRRTTESNMILGCLEKNKGNRTLAAKELGIARSTLYRKLQQFMPRK